MSSIKLSESGFADDGDTEMEYKKAMLHKTHIEEIVDAVFEFMHTNLQYQWKTF